VRIAELSIEPVWLAVKWELSSAVKKARQATRDRDKARVFVLGCDMLGVLLM
jgi:hypothetical protein